MHLALCVWLEAHIRTVAFSDITGAEAGIAKTINRQYIEQSYYQWSVLSLMIILLKDSFILNTSSTITQTGGNEGDVGDE